MMRTFSASAHRRNGVVLLVVISMLTLFAVLGLSFVLYASATADGARLYRDAHTESRPNVDPELLLSFFLGQLLYDVHDDATGVYSALRGHSLARSMFGLNYNPGDPPAVIAQKNAAPYCGTGRMREPVILPGLPPSEAKQNDYNLINYTYFRDDLPTRRFLRDPERPGMRATPLYPDLLTRQRARFVGGYNAPYTYPDLNNMFLAAMKSDGSVMLPSFHRPWTRFDSFEPTNPNWTNAVGKYLTLRPRPIEHLGFPMPEDLGGDVKNLIGYPGTLINGQYAHNDSIWLDLDAPIMKAPDGRKFKPLFAPLITDLDNRVNLNVHGNARGLDQYGRRFHTSNQGWGPWEVNPGHLGGAIDPNAVLTPQQQEWANMVTGSSAPLQRGRLGFEGPPVAGNPPPGTFGRVYSPADLDGANERTGGRSEETRLPGDLPVPPWQCFPNVPGGYGNGSAGELFRHPMLTNAFTSTPPTTVFPLGTHVFPLSNIEALLRYGDTGSPALTSELFRLGPKNFDNPHSPEAIKRRNLVTFHSCDIDRPGAAPFFWTYFALPGSPHYLAFPDNAPVPRGAPIPFPPLRGLFFVADLNAEFDFRGLGGVAASQDWRAIDLAALRRLDLNRYLPPYPAPDSNGIIPISRHMEYRVAARARQIFAEDIFERLWRATGAGRPTAIALSNPSRQDAFRWLAQLAVNIVDFIDPDDYMTPFQWAQDRRPNEWVFGTEMPRLVINEVYVQYDNHNHPASTTAPDSMGNRRAILYAASFWVELHNALKTDMSLPDGGAALLQTREYSAHQLLICGKEQGLSQRNNVLGTPEILHSTVGLFGPPGTPVFVQPSNGQFADQTGTNVGFYVIGPDFNPVDAEAPPLLLPGIQPPQLSISFANRGMTYFPSAIWGREHTILLRRLACPHMQPQLDPTLPRYNPYVTVDYFDGARVNNGYIWDDIGNQRLDPTPYWARQSQGRKQPFAARMVSDQAPKPKPGVLPLPRMPQQSFFQHNVDYDTPGPNWPLDPPPGNSYLPAFDWLVHLDRSLISPMELLHVSAYKPHELTHQFMLSEQQTGKFKHRAPWFDEDLGAQSARLARVLEFFTTRNRMQDMGIALTTLSPPTLVTAGPPVGLPDGSALLTPSAFSGPTLSGGNWSIEKGSALLIRSRPTPLPGSEAVPQALEEVVRVDSIKIDTQGNPLAINARFLLTYPAGSVLEIHPAVLSDRVPGKINLNTIWDAETLLALCDPQPSNVFTKAEVVERIFEDLMKHRTERWREGVLQEKDRPFLGMGVGHYADGTNRLYEELHRITSAPVFPNGGGLEDTFFRRTTLGDPGAARLLHTASGVHKYFENQLLHKIINQTTSRSNVFAVWLTVGFFEVVDDTARPVKLGAELGRAEGKHIRHRMFAVVDRSVMTANPGPQPNFRLGSNPAGPWTTGLVVPYYSIIE